MRIRNKKHLKDLEFIFKWFMSRGKTMDQAWEDLKDIIKLQSEHEKKAK